MDTCVVLPTINEAKNLEILLPKLNNVLSSYDWLAVVVDDGSTDGTQDVVNNFAITTGKAFLIERGRKLGLGSAIKTGMRVCLNKNAKVVVVMDADLQHPPETLPNLVSAVLGGSDLAIASRYVRGGGVTNWSLGRFIVSKGAIYMARFLIPWIHNIRDPISGFFAVNGDKLREIIDSLSDSSGYKLLLELITAAHNRYGDLFRIVEVPYIFRSRVYGVSKLNLGEFVKYAFLVLKLSNYSIFKYIVALLVGSIIGYAVFTALSPINSLMGNFISIESSIMAVITMYQLLMKTKPRLEYYTRYHLVKYFSVAVKLFLFALPAPIIIALMISGILQLLLTMRLISIHIPITHII